MKLPPAHLLVLDYGIPMASHGQGTCVVMPCVHGPYWSVAFPDKDQLDPRTEEELVSGVRDRLIDSVRDRLCSVDPSVPVGVYLSGGIDSAAVLGMATALHKEKLSSGPEELVGGGVSDQLHAFTIAFRESPTAAVVAQTEDGDNGEITEAEGLYDESVSARHCARHCDALYHQLNVSEADLAGAFADAVWHCEAPVLDLNVAGKFLLSRFASRLGFKVVLTGEGADEHFAGYHFFRADYLRAVDGGVGSSSELNCSAELRAGWLAELESGSSWNWSGFPMSNEMCTGRAILGGISTHRQLASLWGLKPDLFAAGALQAGAVSETTVQVPETAGVLGGRKSRVGIGPGPDPCMMAALGVPAAQREQMQNRWHPLHSALCIEQRTMLANLLCCHLGDRTEMAHSLEGRPPFLCHRLTEYVNNVPPSYKLKLPTEKWLLREAVRPFITADVYERAKHPFCAPPSAPCGPFSTLIRETVTAAAVARLGWMQWEPVEHLLVEMVDPTTDPAIAARARNCLCIIMSYIVLSARFNVVPFKADSCYVLK